MSSQFSQKQERYVNTCKKQNQAESLLLCSLPNSIKKMLWCNQEIQEMTNGDVKDEIYHLRKWPT